ncbi:glycosylhydrolase-like jelly roll fold domain-containing protein [Niabella ginsengisoli]|uniref:glycosylhydrolase-like jelly roll fold domain-containing protein n=1 Tax=Niabella ginsengisoli TaxID=522298 RepID=UPI00374CE535
MQLEPHASLIIQSYNNKKQGTRYPYIHTAGDAVDLKGNWKIEFLEGGPELPSSATLITPSLWTELKDEKVNNFSGVAKYTIEFDRPAAAKNYLLDLGEVHETAEVLLNGKKMATLIGPSYTTTIAASDFKQKNKLEIIVANLMANRISYMDKNNIPWKIFYNTNMPARKPENAKNGIFNASHWSPLPSGLSGSVTLTPLK